MLQLHFQEDPMIQQDQPTLEVVVEVLAVVQRALVQTLDLLVDQE